MGAKAGGSEYDMNESRSRMVGLGLRLTPPRASYTTPIADIGGENGGTDPTILKISDLETTPLVTLEGLG